MMNYPIITRLRALLTACFFFGVCTFAFGQNFMLDFNGGLTMSQLEGDKLKGFNQFGYGFGLRTHFRLSDYTYLFVGNDVQKIGSSRNGEDTFTDRSKYLSEVDILSAGVNFGISKFFGDRWDGSRPWKFGGGFGMNSILSLESINYNRDGTNTDLDKSYASSYYYNLMLLAGYQISKNSMIKFEYVHGLSNILKQDFQNISRLQPIYISLKYSYILISK